MTDAGPTRATTRVLDTIELPFSKYIDLAIITHPQLDHYGGFVDLFDHYEFGAFLLTGRVPNEDSLEWNTLVQKIKSRHIPIILISRGDQIRQKGNTIDILSPDPIIRESGELNDTGIVQRVKIASATILLVADISKDIENYLIVQGGLKADILKVAHHGSGRSSSPEFLSMVQPKIAVIGVGENHYGHPNKETLERLRAIVGDNVFRTDKNGTMRIIINGSKSRILTEKG